MRKKIKVVSIGGGTGQAALLRGLKHFDIDLTAIVTVLDSGRSTGVIRQKFKIAAPGDLRNCIIALSESEEEFNKIFQHRFKSHFKGMNVGNLILAALNEMSGSFESAIEEFSSLFKMKGKVYPNTLKNTHICAELTNGKIICSEHEIRNTKTPPVKRVWLKHKKAKGHKKAIQSLKEADYIIIGPGGLYTSVIVNFLVEDIRNAIVKSKAKKIFVPNLATQPGVMEEKSILTQISEVTKYLTKGKKVINYVVLNKKNPPLKTLKRYEKEKTFYIEPKKEEIEILKKQKYGVVESDLVDRKIRREWKKNIYMRHDPERLADTIMKIIQPKKHVKGVILAAGTGSRMKPFSLSSSKTMIKFLGKPLLAHHVDEFLKNGIDKIIFICNTANVSTIKEYFEKKYSKHTFQYCIQEKQLGPAHALLSAEKFLKHCFFILKYGDSISKEDQIKGVLSFFTNSKEKKGVVTLRDVSNPSDYGIAKFENGRLVEIVEKPKQNPPSRLANVGLTLLDANLYFHSLHKHGFTKILPPPEYLLMEKEHLDYWISRSERVDVGRAHNIITANKLLIDKFGGRVDSVNVSASAKISKKAYVGPDSSIESGVIIGDYVSVEGHVGKNTKISNSVIMSGTKIGKNCNVKHSVIGKNNFIEDGFLTKTGEVDIYIKDKYVSPGMEVGVFTGDDVLIKGKITSNPGKMVFPNKIVSEHIKKDKLIRTFVFDADNTVWDTRSIAKYADMAAMNLFSKKTGFSPKKLYLEWKQIVQKIQNAKNPKKRHRKYSYGLLLKKYGVKNPGVLVNKGFEELKKVVTKRIKVLQGFNKIKPYLKKSVLCICTEDSKDLFRAKLNATNLSDFFDVCITSDDVGEMKPSKKYYDLLFKKIEHVPTECLFIGDNYKKDLQIPQKMGATTVLISNNNGNGADFKIKSYKYFLDLLKEI